MRIDFSEIFHQSSKDSSWGGRVRIPQDSSEWPDEWKTIYYKAYPRLPILKLPKPKEIKLSLSNAIRERKTERNFSGLPFSLSELSTLLKTSAGTTGMADDNPRRAYPSGGARFPIEIYPIVFHGNEDLPSGVYHYDPKDHCLSVLWERGFTVNDISQITPYDWVRNASMILVLTAVFRRSRNKYAERGYRYILLEAGHLGENVYLSSTALGLKCCGLGGVRDECLEKIIDIDGVTESIVYVLALGK